MAIRRARFLIDALIETPDDAPLTSNDLLKILNIGADALRIQGPEPLSGKKKFEIIIRPDWQNQHVHYHDARYDSCRACRNAASDDLGPIE